MQPRDVNAARRHPCALPKCKREATVAHDVHSSGMETRRALREGKYRHYEVCDEHDAEFFGRGGFLRSDQSERITKELRPRV